MALAVCLLAAGPAAAQQVCKYDSIAATAPASRFTDNGDGTVTDTGTGLQWKRCSEGQTWNGGTCIGSATNHVWQQALQLAEAASYAGKDDWRLPNVKELASIVELACYNPAINSTTFPATPAYYYWSSSPYAHGPAGAWYVYFHFGLDGHFSKTNVSRVRLVRGGQ
jgi:hypothetical protein